MDTSDIEEAHEISNIIKTVKSLRDIEAKFDFTIKQIELENVLHPEVLTSLKTCHSCLKSSVIPMDYFLRRWNVLDKKMRQEMFDPSISTVLTSDIRSPKFLCTEHHFEITLPSGNQSATTPSISNTSARSTVDSKKETIEKDEESNNIIFVHPGFIEGMQKTNENTTLVHDEQIDNDFQFSTSHQNQSVENHFHADDLDMENYSENLNTRSVTSSAENSSSDESFSSLLGNLGTSSNIEASSTLNDNEIDCTISTIQTGLSVDPMTMKCLSPTTIRVNNTHSNTTAVSSVNELGLSIPILLNTDRENADATLTSMTSDSINFITKLGALSTSTEKLLKKRKDLSFTIVRPNECEIHDMEKANTADFEISAKEMELQSIGCHSNVISLSDEVTITKTVTRPSDVVQDFRRVAKLVVAKNTDWTTNVAVAGGSGTGCKPIKMSKTGKGPSKKIGHSRDLNFHFKQTFPKKQHHMKTRNAPQEELGITSVAQLQNSLSDLENFIKNGTCTEGKDLISTIVNDDASLEDMMDTNEC